MKNKLTKLFTLLLSVLAIICFAVACATNTTPDNGGEGQNPPSHTHEYPTTYSYDTNNHWFECECGEDKGNAPHTFIDGKCVCGYEKEEGGSTTEHTHNYILNFDSDKHWQECVCGNKKEIVQHIYSDNKCSCGYIKPAEGHTHVAGEWIVETPATCQKLGYRYKRCACGSIVETGMIDYVAHDYVYGECSVCTAIDSTYMTEGLIFEFAEDEDGYIVNTYIGTSVDIIVPAIYKGKPVVAISESAFVIKQDKGQPIETLKIHGQNLEIRDQAFAWCGNLKSVELLDGVTSIGDNAFRDCDSLTSVEIPDSVTSIGVGAFSSCTSLTSIVIGDSVTSIGGRAFSSCTSLTSIVIGESVTSIGEYAFSGGYDLTYIEVEENNQNYKSIDGNLYTKDGKTLVKYAIGKTAKSFSIPNSVTSIGDGAFSNCYSLTSVEIPDSVTSIGDGAFSNCYLLTSVEIPDSVTSIGDSAFWGCSSLTSVVIPDSVTSIGGWAFSNCDSLTIYCEAESEPDGWDYNWNLSNRPVVWGYKG